MKRLVLVPENRLEEFKERLAKINKKAEKYGCQKIQILEESELYDYTEDEVNYIICKDFTLEIPEIKLGDYEVVGVIKHPARGHEEFEVIQFYGEEGLSKRYADIQPTRCDHCNTERYRTCQIVLRNKEGKEIVVGKSCVEEYTGIKLHADYRLFAETDFDEEFDFISGGYSIPTYELSKVVKIAVESIRKDGYIRKSEQDLQLNIIPTFQRIMAVNFNKVDGDEELLKEYRNYIETNNFDSDFMNNLKSISKLNHIVEDYFPMVACGVNMFLKNKQRVEFQKKVQNSQFVGNEGDKLEIDVEVRRISYFETMYGRSARVEFSQNGNMIVWFTNVQSFENQNLKENKTYRIKGTVKKHEVFNNTNQTILTRVKVL